MNLEEDASKENRIVLHEKIKDKSGIPISKIFYKKLDTTLFTAKTIMKELGKFLIEKDIGRIAIKKEIENYGPISDEAVLVDVVNEPFQSVINKIGKAKIVVSSSLHGLIFAEAYNKPAIWLKVTDKIIGGNFKFHDYYEGTNRRNSPAIWDEKFSFLSKSKPPAIPLSNKYELIDSLKVFCKSQGIGWWIFH